MSNQTQLPKWAIWYLACLLLFTCGCTARKIEKRNPSPIESKITACFGFPTFDTLRNIETTEARLKLFGKSKQEIKAYLKLRILTDVDLEENSRYLILKIVSTYRREHGETVREVYRLGLDFGKDDQLVLMEWAGGSLVEL